MKKSNTKKYLIVFLIFPPNYHNLKFSLSNNFSRFPTLTPIRLQSAPKKRLHLPLVVFFWARHETQLLKIFVRLGTRVQLLAVLQQTHKNLSRAIRKGEKFTFMRISPLFFYR